jgi:hypothetical protein
MAKRSFFILLVLLACSFLFVQVSEATAATLTITKIGFYVKGEVPEYTGGSDIRVAGSDNPPPNPQTQYIVELPSPQTVHIEGGGSTNPNISDFVYQGNIPNGTFTHIGLFIDSSVIPGFTGWQAWGFDYHGTPSVEKIFNESDRKLITIHMLSEYSNATVENL